MAENQKLRKYDNVSFRPLEFVGKTDFSKELEGIDVVYHLISTITPSDDMGQIWQDLESNVKPTIALLNSLAKKPDCKLVFISSGGTVYGNKARVPLCETVSLDPVCNYGLTKEIIEKYIYFYHHMYGLDYRIIRLGNPYGTKVRKGQKQGLIPIFIDKIMNGEPVTVFGDGKAVRDYIHVDDAIAGILAVEQADCEEKVFNIGFGEGHSVLQILSMIEEELGCEPTEVDYIPGRKCDVYYNVLDTSLVRERTGWAPAISLRDGIRMMLESIRNEE
jgi:UDP-glucose 4-epimerase